MATGQVRICWFCRKGRHGECMRVIPMNSRSSGPHDCTFDTRMIECGCSHCMLEGTKDDE